MIITTILCVLTGFGIHLSNKNDDFLEFIGIAMSCCFGLYLIIHLIFWSSASFTYSLFVEERKAFVSTLENARSNNRQLEVAAVTKEIINWNTSLAKCKFKNDLFILDKYIDDRIEGLEPIE